MCNNCEDCVHLKCIPMVCHGVMDCEPPEIYCDIDLLDEDGECARYKYHDELQDRNDYEDWQIRKWECDNDK